MGAGPLGIKEACFGPVADMDDALAVVIFLSETDVVLEDVGRLEGAGPPAFALLGRVLAAAIGVCDTRPRGVMNGKIRWKAKEKKNKEMITALKPHKQHKKSCHTQQNNYVLIIGEHK